MTRIETEEVEVIKTETIVKQEVRICNKCGKEIIATYLEDFAHFNLSFGYESRFDGEEWKWDVCPDCLLEWIKTFKYAPEGFFQDRYNWLDPEQHQLNFEEWKETNKWK